MAAKGRAKNKGDLRGRLTGEDYRPAGDADAGVSQLAAELAGTMGKTVTKATELGLEVVEDVGLKVMEVLSKNRSVRPSSLGRAAAFFTRTRAKAPEFSGQVASKVTNFMVIRSFGMLRAIHDTVRKTHRPG